MIKIKKIFYFSIFIFLLVSIFFYTKIFKEKEIKLVNGYVWKCKKVKNSMVADSNYSLIKDLNGKNIIGPGVITIWAKYPWIYGTLISNEKVSYFAINTISCELLRMNANEYRKFRNKNSMIFSPNREVTFQDIYDGAQWQNKQKTKKIKLIFTNWQTRAE
jgi:hypothetical protein